MSCTLGEGTRPLSLLATIIAVFAGQTACRQEPTRSTEVSTGVPGCTVEQVTDETHDAFQSRGVSADGAWVSVGWSDGEDADGNSVRGSYVLNVETKEQRDLGEPINHASSFSPDGRLLGGAQYLPEGRTDIFEYDVDTGEATVIAQDPAWDFLPTYSPDGRWIVFNSSRTGNSELFVYDRTDGTLRQITDFEGYDAHGEFSPDGTKILFHRQLADRPDGGYDFDLYSHDLASGDETRLTATSLEESYGSWAPDGRALVFTSESEADPERRNLYVRHEDGTLAQLTDGPWKDTYAQWLRDGSYIYFNSSRGGSDDIYRIRMNGLDCVR